MRRWRVRVRARVRVRVRVRVRDRVRVRVRVGTHLGVPCVGGGLLGARRQLALHLGRTW